MLLVFVEAAPEPPYLFTYLLALRSAQFVSMLQFPAEVPALPLPLACTHEPPAKCAGELAATLSTLSDPSKRWCMLRLA